MKRSTLMSFAAALAAMAFANLAFAHPDAVVAIWHGVTNHADVLSLAFGPAVVALQGRQATTVAAMRSMMDAASAAGVDFTPEQQAEFDKHSSALKGLKAQVAREQAMELEEAGMTAVAAASHSSVAVAAASSISVRENVQDDPKRGFKTFGEFARSVGEATRTQRQGHGAIDQRLVIGAAAPGTFGGEGSGTDGGFLIAPGFSENIFVLSMTDGSLLPYVDSMEIDGNSMLIPKDETTPWGTNGIRAYWQGEGLAGTPTKPVVGAMDLRLKKLLALVPVSDEMVSDTNALNSYLPKKVAMSIQWKTNEAILFGTGTGLPQGALASGALVTQVKDTGQATLTLSTLNLANMISRLPPGSFPNAIWIINNNVLPALFTLTLGNFPIYMAAGASVGGIQTSPYGTLLGRPIMVSQHAKSFSAQGDVMLVDLSYYQAIVKAGGVQTATSMHLYFDADAMAFRTTFRMDGQSKIATPISPANGSTTLSPFVQFGAR
jgi:HK97 family phage major capsid protein